MDGGTGMTRALPQEMDNHTFRLAVAQFDRAAELMRLDPNLRQRLKLIRVPVYHVPTISS